MKRWFHKILKQKRMHAHPASYEYLAEQLVKFANENSFLPGEIIVVHFFDGELSVGIQIMYYSTQEVK